MPRCGVAWSYGGFIFKYFEKSPHWFLYRLYGFAVLQIVNRLISSVCFRLVCHVNFGHSDWDKRKLKVVLTCSSLIAGTVSNEHSFEILLSHPFPLLFQLRTLFRFQAEIFDSYSFCQMCSSQRFSPVLCTASSPGCFFSCSEHFVWSSHPVSSGVKEVLFRKPFPIPISSRILTAWNKCQSFMFRFLIHLELVFAQGIDMCLI